MKQNINRVCPRCGKTRVLKTPTCQPCAVILTNKRRYIAPRFRLDEKTVDEKLASISNA
jgi:hypothetical protein